jgi:hypothetical protein
MELPNSYTPGGRFDHQPTISVGFTFGDVYLLLRPLSLPVASVLLESFDFLIERSLETGSTRG